MIFIIVKVLEQGRVTGLHEGFNPYVYPNKRLCTIKTTVVAKKNNSSGFQKQQLWFSETTTVVFSISPDCDRILRVYVLKNNLSIVELRK